MALFKVCRGLSSALPQTITDGYCYYTTDDNKFYIDAYSTRKCINNIPTALSALSDDASHRLVTDTQISAWNAKSNFSGSYSDLSNKPTLGTASQKDVPTSGNASTTQVVMGNDTRLSDARSASDVYSWAKASSKPTYTASEVGAIASTLKGTANGVAELDANGLVPSSQLPSYVDDVIEGYYYNSKFYKESTHTTEIIGETGKVYVDVSTNITYRWSGSAYVAIGSDLALGETSSTAYRGDRGKVAYDHSQSAHARTDATKTEASSTNGNIKIDGSEVTVYTHPSGTNPHGTTKSDVGLGNVGNFKAVSTEASQGLSSTEQSNARTNIGAGTSSLTLGETGTTAYRGDRGKTAYDHSQASHAPADATKTEASSTNGNIKISGSEVTVYTHPTTSGNKHIPSGGSSGKFLKWASDGTATWADDNNTWTAMVGATSSANGSVGYVNAVPPSNGYNTKFLRADGTWNVPVSFSVSGTTLSITT